MRTPRLISATGLPTRVYWFSDAHGVLVAAVWVLVACAAAPGATVIHVNAAAPLGGDGLSWATARRTVASGLAAARGGDSVWVAAGTYVERISLKNGVALYGGFAGHETELAQRDWRANPTVLDGDKKGSVVAAPAGTTATTRIDGFTIRNGSETPGTTHGAGVACVSSSPTISNNTIVGNTQAYLGGGIYCYNASPVITGNVIEGNTSGIDCDESSSPVISENQILRNSGTGIACYLSSPNISRNVIAENGNSGIYCGRSSSPRIFNNSIKGNTASIAGGGIRFYEASSPLVSNNIIAGNTAATGGGISCDRFSLPTISNNTIASNSARLGGGISCFDASPTLTNNLVAINSSGIHSSGSQDPPTLRNNCVYNPGGTDYSGLTAGPGDISVDPQLLAAEYGEVHLKEGSPCINAGDDAAVQASWVDLDGEPRIQGGRVDIGADEFNGATPSFTPRIIRVKPSGNDANDGSSWDLAKKTVQAGINEVAAFGGAEVWVASGTYNERVVLKPGAFLYGGFAGSENTRDERDWTAHVTILDGQAGGSVVTALTGFQVSRLDGFTIRNGSGASYGGGIYCFGASLTIANNAIEGNAAGAGGGIYCAQSYSTIENNTITGNTGGGSGIRSVGSSLTIANNTIKRNKGAAVVGEDSTLTILGNSIEDNTAGYGGGIACSRSTLTVSGNSISRNVCADATSALACNDCTGAILNNSIIENTATLGAGGISVSTSGPLTISGNTIARHRGSGIVCSGPSSLVISRNRITGNIRDGGPNSASGAGISCDGSPTIVGNIIMNNAVSGGNSSGGAGISCSGSPTISNNTIVGNAGSNDGGAGGGIRCEIGSSPVISNNLIAFNTSGLFASGGTPVLSHNCVYNPGGTNYAGLAPGIGDISVAPGLSRVEYGEVHLTAGSPCIDAGDDAAVQAGGLDVDGEPRQQGAHVDIGADEFNGATPPFTPTLVRVSPSGNDANDGSSWDLAKRTVQAGIDATAGSGGEVWVAAGLYVERVTLRAWVHLYGGFAGTETGRDQRNPTGQVTTLDGHSAGSVVTVPPASGMCSVDGFTIRNGTGTAAGVYSHGGGIHCSGSLVTLAGNVVTDNVLNHDWSGTSFGAGIYCLNSSVVISGNMISDNRISIPASGPAEGGGVSIRGSTAMIVNNTIRGNVAKAGSEARGGGIYFSGPSATIANNVIVGNTTSAGGNPEIGGGGLFCSGRAIISNNTMVGNVAEEGGGICLLGLGPFTFSSNIVAHNSSGIRLYTATATPVLISNCVYNPGGTDYSGLTAGPGEISVDPQLLAAEYGEVHLKEGSPCINAGDDAAVQASWVDLDGEARIQGGRVDIGADEFNGTTPSFTPRIIRVRPSGNDANDGSTWDLAKKTVQAGINTVANSGGVEVWVAAGTYPERILLKPGAFLYGGFAGSENARDERDWAAHATILDGQAGGSVVTAIAGFRVSRLDGFTIRNGTGTVVDNKRNGGGIYCSSAAPWIVNNVIAGNTAALGAGICCIKSSPTIANNTIYGNTAYLDGGYGGGFYGDNSSALISNNLITGNGAWRSGGGVYCRYASPVISNNRLTGNGASESGGGVYCAGKDVKIVGNTIAGNSSREGGGVYGYGSPKELVNNIVAFNSSGIAILSGAPALRGNCVYNPAGANYAGIQAGLGNISVDPQLVAVEYGEVHLRAGSPCIDAGDPAAVQPGEVDMDGQPRVQGAGVDMGADEFNGAAPSFVPTAIRVSSSGDDGNDGLSWATAKRTVQAGIDAASTNGAEVWVAAGTYDERVTLRTWVHLFGGFAGAEADRSQRNWATHRSILDGGGAGTVVNVPPGSGICRIDGFTIRNGHSAAEGGGIRCEIALPTVSNNTITENTARDGGGIYCFASSPTISDNLFLANSARGFGGGMQSLSCKPEVIGCRFLQNTAASGGGFDSFGNASLTNCTFIRNSAKTGAGLYTRGSTATVVNCTFSGNSATSGGGVYHLEGNSVLINCTFAGNTATSGAGVYDLGGSRILTNCTFSGNSAASGAALHGPYGAAKLTNCILWANSSPPKAGTGSSLTYCDVQGGWAGNGNIDRNPLFVRNPKPGADGVWGTPDDDYGDLRLQPGSPCIDAGKNAALPAWATADLAGSGRFQDDPSTSDTGLGSAPIVDLGAFEFGAPGFFDGGSFVDQADLAIFKACATGPGVPYNPAALPEGCTLTPDDQGRITPDLDKDGDVDQEDFGVFQRCYSGPGRLADPICAK